MTLQEVVFESPLFGERRIPRDINDFGDNETVGLKVKRNGRTFFQQQDHDFGVYLGYVNGQYHIGTCEIMSFVPSELESFATLEELKQQWELD